MVNVIILSIIFLIVDQISKILVSNNLTSKVTIINNFFYLTKAYNKGAAWSILKGERLFLILVALVTITLLLIYIKKNNIRKKSNIIAFSLIIGGALGNLLDRIIYGYVIDFLDFVIINYDFPIFNLADTFIVIGIILLLIQTYRKEDKNDNN